MKIRSYNSFCAPKLYIAQIYFIYILPKKKEKKSKMKNKRERASDQSVSLTADGWTIVQNCCHFIFI